MSAAEPAEITVLVVTEGDGAHAFLAELARNPCYRPAGRVTSVAAAVEAARLRSPDVVVVEMVTVARIVELAGLARDVDAGVVVVSDLPAEVGLLPCMAAGARGFVCSAAGEGVLDRAVAVVAEGLVHLDAAGLAWLVEVAVDRYVPRGEGIPTVRQAQVMKLVRSGMSNREIAHTLGVSTETVKSHVHRVMRGLGVHDRWEAAARMDERVDERTAERNGHEA